MEISNPLTRAEFESGMKFIHSYNFSDNRFRAIKVKNGLGLHKHYYYLRDIISKNEFNCYGIVDKITKHGFIVSVFVFRKIIKVKVLYEECIAMRESESAPTPKQN